MSRSARQLILSFGALVAVIGLAACGSSSNGSSATTAAASVGTTATTAGGAAAATAGAVQIKGFAFKPGDLTIKAGSEVTWTNEDSTTHKIKSDDGTFNSDNLGNGATFSHTFDKAGTFAYICSIHPTMKGTITVTA